MVTSGCSGCRVQSAASAARTRQARAEAQREEELKYRDEDGNTDWRGRVDAAKEALESAQSESTWGSDTKALEYALDASRLLPPPGMDFDLPKPTSANSNPQSTTENTKRGDVSSTGSETDLPSNGENQTQAGGERERTTGGADNDKSGGEDAADKSTGNDVTNEEVAEIRAEVNKLLESLDDGGQGSNARLDRGVIEIE